MLPFLNRNYYYSQTEVVKLFKVSINRFKQLIIENNISVVSHELMMGTLLKPYTVTTIYILKDDVTKMNLEPRKN